MSSVNDLWGGPAWAFQPKADAVYDLLNGVVLAMGNTTITGTLAVSGVATFAAEPIIVIDGAGTNAVVDLLTVRTTSTGTPAAGLGAAVVFEVENDTPAVHEAGRIEVDWATVTAASEDSDMRFDVYDGGTKVTPLAIIGATPQVTVTGALAVTGVATFDSEPIVAIDSAATATVVDTLTLRNTSTGTPAAGLGTGLVFEIENDAPAAHEAARIEVDWETETSTSEDSDLRIDLYDAGSKITALSLIGSDAGKAIFNNGVAPGPYATVVQKVKKTSIAAAACLTLNSAPVALTEAPAAGSFIIFKYAVISYVAAAAGAAAGAGTEDLMIEFTGGTDAAIVCLFDNDTGGINFTGTTSKRVIVPSLNAPFVEGAVVAPLAEAEGLQLLAVGADWTVFDGAINVIVFYDVVTY